MAFKLAETNICRRWLQDLGVFNVFFVQLVNHLINVQEGAISCVCPVASSFYSSLLQHIFVIYFFVALSLPIAASSKNDFCTDREEPMVQWSDRKASIRS